MAKVDTADAPKKKKKAKSVRLADGVALKVKVKKDKKPGGKKASAKSEPAGNSPLEMLAKLADHPMVADLIAAGATAAVAALASRGLSSDKKKGQGNAAKVAGTAAAAAIGKKLMGELQGVKDAAVDAAKKS